MDGFQKLFRIRILQKFFENSNPDTVRTISIKHVTKNQPGTGNPSDSFRICVFFFSRFSGI